VKKLLLTLLAVFLLSATAFIAPAYAFRCGDGGRNLASEGMHKYQILKDCGEPDLKEVVGVDGNGRSCRIVEEWLYIINNFGNKQMYLIKFDKNGIAIGIEWLGR